MIADKKPKEDISVEACIALLELVRDLISRYEENHQIYTKEYCKQIAKLEVLAIDKVIERLRLLFMVNNGESESINRKEST